MFKHSTTFNNNSSETVLGMCIRQKDPRTRVLGLSLSFACFVEQGRVGESRAGQGRAGQSRARTFKKQRGFGGKEGRVRRVRGREGKVR